MVEAKFIAIQTFINHKAYEREGSYAYSSIVGGFLHLQVAMIFLPSLRISRISLPTSRREIHGYKLPSTYITNFSLSALGFYHGRSGGAASPTALH
jgi:hypothetical protein